jgi:hypothetical protein
MCKLQEHKYCDEFAQGIAGQQPGGHVLAHAPHNNATGVFPSCLDGPLLYNACTGGITQQCVGIM